MTMGFYSAIFLRSSDVFGEVEQRTLLAFVGVGIISRVGCAGPSICCLPCVRKLSLWDVSEKHVL